MALNNELRALIKLQRGHLHEEALLKERESLPAKRLAAEQNLEELRTAYKQAEQELHDAQGKVRKAELELQAGEDNLEKVQGQLHLVKTNKEYTAALHEIETFKHRNAEIEDTILTLMEEVERSHRELPNEKNFLQLREKEIQAEMASIADREKAIDAELNGIANDRERCRKEANPELLERFDRLRTKLGGPALVPIEDGTCGACHITLSPRTIHRAKAGTGLPACESCSRLLYLEEEAD